MHMKLSMSNRTTVNKLKSALKSSTQITHLIKLDTVLCLSCWNNSVYFQSSHLTDSTKAKRFNVLIAKIACVCCSHAHKSKTVHI